MSDEQRRDETPDDEREDTVKDLDVSEEEGEDVRGGLGRHPRPAGDIKQ